MSPDLRGTSRVSSSRLPAVWLAAAALLLVPGFSKSRLPPLKSLRVPGTPVDLVWERYARFWAFLKDARPYVPSGQTYTVLAADREDEMYLFMMSLGIFEKQAALPTSYFGNPTPEGARARYVLAYRNVPADPNDRLVVRLEGGAIYDRGLSRP